MNIYVGNLAKSVTENDLNEAFESYGKVESASIIKDKYSGESKGFGFVEMPVKEEALEAIKALNDSELDGEKIKVNEARPKKDDRRGGAGNRRGGGFGGGKFGGNKYGGGGYTGGGRHGGGGKHGPGGHRG